MSSNMGLPPEGDESVALSSILDDQRYRAILSILLAHSEPLTERDLAVQLAARETDSSPPSVTETDCRSIRVDLYHRCLPKLDEGGWIERHPEGVVASQSLSAAEETSPVPAVDDPAVRPEHVAVVGSHSLRPAVLGLLVDEEQPLTLEELVTKLLAQDHPSWTIDGDESSLPIVLHHVHLPALADLGVLQYDPAEKTIRSARPLTAEWLSLVSVE